jgi:hypothetical protein
MRLFNVMAGCFPGSLVGYMGIYNRRFLVHETFAPRTESKVGKIQKHAPTYASDPPSENTGKVL